MTWCCGSTRAPYLRTTSPSTSTRPSPIISSQCLRLPTPAAASTFCSRTPPGTSTSESRSSSESSRRSWSRPSWPRLSWPRPSESRPRWSRSRWSRLRWLMTRVSLVVDVVRQERGQLRQRIQARQAEPLQEVAGRREQDRACLRVRACLLDEPAQHQSADHAVAVDAAHGRYPGAAHRLPVGDHGQGLERRLGQPDLLAVAHESLDERGALLAGVEAPAAGYLAQLEAALLRGVGASQVAEGLGDLCPRPLEHLRDDDF